MRCVAFWKLALNSDENMLKRRSLRNIFLGDMIFFVSPVEKEESCASAYQNEYFHRNLIYRIHRGINAMIFWRRNFAFLSRARAPGKRCQNSKIFFIRRKLAIRKIKIWVSRRCDFPFQRPGFFRAVPSPQFCFFSFKKIHQWICLQTDKVFFRSSYLGYILKIENCLI